MYWDICGFEFLCDKYYMSETLETAAWALDLTSDLHRHHFREGSSPSVKVIKPGRPLRHRLTHKHGASPRLAVKTGGVLSDFRAGETFQFMCQGSSPQPRYWRRHVKHPNLSSEWFRSFISASASPLGRKLLSFSSRQTFLSLSSPQANKIVLFLFNETFNPSGDNLNKDITW